MFWKWLQIAENLIHWAKDLSIGVATKLFKYTLIMDKTLFKTHPKIGNLIMQSSQTENNYVHEYDSL